LIFDRAVAVATFVDVTAVVTTFVVIDVF